MPYLLSLFLGLFLIGCAGKDPKIITGAEATQATEESLNDLTQKAIYLDTLKEESPSTENPLLDTTTLDSLSQ